MSACAGFDRGGRLSAAQDAFGQGRYAQAERLGQRALADAERAGDPAATGRAAGFLAGVESLEGRSAQAERYYRRALASYEGSAEPRPAAAAATAYDLAGALSLEGKTAEAENLYVHAVALSDKPGVPREELFERLGGLGLFYETQRRFDEAERLYRRAAVVAQGLGGAYVQQAREDLDGLAARKTGGAR